MTEESNNSKKTSRDEHSLNSQYFSDRSASEYLCQLFKDFQNLSYLPNCFYHVEKILKDEINKVRLTLLNSSNAAEEFLLPEPQGSLVFLSEKLFIPVKEYPDFNFVGRILGPRGMTAKQLEHETGCKIMIRGRGSMRDDEKEEKNRTKPNWEHLNQELHVLITVEDTAQRAELKLKKAVFEISKLLQPSVEGDDELKKIQLIELAILNGTYRNDYKSYGRANSYEAANTAIFTPLRASVSSLPTMYYGTGPAPVAGAIDPTSVPQAVQQPFFVGYMPPTGFIADLGNVFYFEPCSLINNPSQEEFQGGNN